MTGAHAVGRNTITVLEPKLEDELLVKTIKAGHSWFRGLIPPKSFAVHACETAYVPYLIIEVWYRNNPKKWRRCFIFWNREQNYRKGVLGIDNLAYQEIEAPENLLGYDYDRISLEKEIITYCKLEMLAKHYRKFIDWEIEIHDVKEIYRMKRHVKYTVNGKLRTKDVYLDNFILK